MATLKLGDVLGDPVVQPELALLEQLHQRRGGGDHLGEGGAVEDGIHRHGFRLRDQRALPVGLAVDDLAVVPDQQNGAGQAVLAMAWLMASSIAGAPAKVCAEREAAARAAQQRSFIWI